MATKAERVLGNPKQLTEYLKTLPIDFELRFPSITSLKGKFAGVMIIHDVITDRVLFGAYNTKLSGLPKDEVEVEGVDIDTEETIFTLLRFGITKETGLVAQRIKLLGLPYKVVNTNPNVDAEFHERNYALIDKFKGSVKMPDEVLNPKITEFVWVKVSLLGMILDQRAHLRGVPVKPHPQKEAYKRFIENNSHKNNKQKFFGRIFSKRTKFKKR